MAKVPDFTYLTPAERTSMRAALLAEMNRRAGIGAVVAGASQGQSITMSKLSEDALAAWWSAINATISGDPITNVRPIFIRNQ